MNSGRGPKKERGRKMRLFLFFFQRGDFKNWSPSLGNFHFYETSDCARLRLGDMAEWIRASADFWIAF